MIRNITIYLIAVCSSVHLLAQAPQGINYQGVARDLEGKPLAQKEISVRISVLDGSADGSVEYDEIHEIRTNSFGLFSLVIGKGTPGTGSFNFIGWTSGNKWLQVELDENGGRNFKLMGSQQFMSVPYALYAERSGNGYQAGQGISIANNAITNTGDADNNPTNELITDVTLGTDNKLRITDAGGTKEADLSGLMGAGQNLSGVLNLGNSAANNRITNLSDPVNAADAATKSYVDNHSDGDANASNEIQNLQQVLSEGNNAGGITLTNLGAPTLGSDAATKQYVDNLDATDGDKSSSNEIQTVSKSGAIISLSAGGGSVTLNDDNPNNEIQALSTQSVDPNTRSVSISGSNTINVDVRDADSNPSNEIQNLSSVLTQGTDAGGAKITNLGAPTINTDAATKAYVDNLDALDGDKSSANEIQNLSSTISGTNRTINISGGTGTTIDVADNDNSSTNELQNLSSTISGTNRSINISGGTGTTIDVADNDNSSTNEIQNLSSSISGTNRTINISGGTGTTIDVADNDNSVTNEIQDLSLTGNTLSLSSDPTSVNLSGYLDNTDSQSLSYNGGSKQLTISGGNTVTIPETQNLSHVLTLGNSAGTSPITNLGNPSSPQDATTKSYVDAADAALSARISTTYAFKGTFNYTNTSGVIVSDQTMPITTEDFDTFNVLGVTNFTANESGTYIFFVEGFYNTLSAGGSLSLFYNGVKYPITIVQPFGATQPRFSGTFMFQLSTGETVSLVGDNIAVGAQFNGKFFGNKL